MAFDRQAYFNAGVLGVLNQRAFARNAGGTCVFRDECGNKCFAGHSIADDVYAPWMECYALNRTSESEYDYQPDRMADRMCRMLQCAVGIDHRSKNWKADVEFAAALQTIHDSCAGELRDLSTDQQMLLFAGRCAEFMHRYNEVLIEEDYSTRQPLQFSPEVRHVLMSIGSGDNNISDFGQE